MRQSTRYELSDKQFDNLEISTRRSLMLQLMFLHTPKYMYAIGANGNLWIICRYDRNESIGGDKWEKGYVPTIIDKWV